MVLPFRGPLLCFPQSRVQLCVFGEVTQHLWPHLQNKGGKKARSFISPFSPDSHHQGVYHFSCSVFHDINIPSHSLFFFSFLSFYFPTPHIFFLSLSFLPQQRRGFPVANDFSSQNFRSKRALWEPALPWSSGPLKSVLGVPQTLKHFLPNNAELNCLGPRLLLLTV